MLHKFGYPRITLNDYIRTFCIKLKSPKSVVKSSLSIAKYLKDKPVSFCPTITASAIIFLAYMANDIYITKTKISDTLPVSKVALTISTNQLEKEYGLSGKKIDGDPVFSFGGKSIRINELWGNRTKIETFIGIK